MTLEIMLSFGATKCLFCAISFSLVGTTLCWISWALSRRIPRSNLWQLSNCCMPLLPLTRTSMLSCRLSHPSSREKSYGSRGLGSAVLNAQPSPPAISNAESLALRLLEDHSREAANRMVTLKCERHAMIRTVPQMATPTKRDVQLMVESGC